VTLVAPVTLATVLLVGSCGTNADGAFVRVGEPGPDRVEGRARRVGTRTLARTLIETTDGGSIVVTGAYAAEIGRLAGAEVRVTGSAGGTEAAPAIEATSYEILSVDGDPVTIGTLRSDGSGHYLESRGQTVRVGAVSGDLARLEGSLVWVVLDENGGVSRYGILRLPPGPGEPRP